MFVHLYFVPIHSFAAIAHGTVIAVSTAESKTHAVRSAGSVTHLKRTQQIAGGTFGSGVFRNDTVGKFTITVYTIRYEYNYKT